MINVKHPLEKYNTAQENFINNLADKDKEYHSLLFSYGNASYLYHNLPIEPTFEDYTEWLEGLQENIRKRCTLKVLKPVKAFYPLHVMSEKKMIFTWKILL